MKGVINIKDKLCLYVKKYKKAFILSIIFSIVEVILELLIPYLMTALVDKGISVQDMPYTIKISVIMFFMVLVSLTFGIAVAKYSAIVGQGIGYEIRQDEYRQIQKFSLSKLQKFSTSSLVTRVTNDVTIIENCLIMSIKLLVKAPIMFMAAMILTLIINRRLALVFLVSMPILIIAMICIVMKSKSRFLIMQNKVDNLNRVVQENLSGMRVVKSYVREETEKNKFSKVNGEIFKAAKDSFFIVILNMPVIQIILFGTIIAILWFGGNMVAEDQLTIGQLSSFIAYAVELLTALILFSMILMMIARSSASMERILEIICLDSNENNSENSSLKVNNGEIIFKDVCFKYNEKSDIYNLEKLNFKINSGETVGIIGPTGSGKTTLINLIPRLYYINEGEIYIGGNNINEYDLRELRKEISVVSQKNILFSRTIKENIKWSDEDASDDKVKESAEIAYIDDFIEKLPDGYDTNLKQNATNLSGGQKQRISIARALLKDCKILILDNCTSSLDNVTEANIWKRLSSELKDTTKIIISQKISSVSNADKIIVMNDGRISAFGTHEELLKDSDIYKDMYNCQHGGVSICE